MSGYSSKSEAVKAVQGTILNVAKTANLPVDVKAYYVNRIVEDVAYDRGHRYGWGLEMDVKIWEESLKKNRRSNYEPIVLGCDCPRCTPNF